MITVYKGKKGYAVELLQRLLRLPVTGVFDDTTMYAVSAYQQRSGLVSDGIVGVKTWRRLFLDRAQDNLSLKKTAKPAKLDVSAIEEGIIESLGVIFNNNPRNRDFLIQGFNTLKPYLTIFKLDTRDRILHFTSQLREEVGRNIVVTENLNYSCRALPKVFRYYRIHKSEAFDDGRCNGHAARQPLIARKAYGGRLGNHPYPSMDGWLYRGRGGSMVTGFDNYVKLWKDLQNLAPELNFNPVSHPNFLASKRYWLVSAAVFWAGHKAYLEADAGINKGASQRITRIYNKYTHSYDSRYRHLQLLNRTFV